MIASAANTIALGFFGFMAPGIAPSIANFDNRCHQVWGIFQVCMSRCSFANLSAMPQEPVGAIQTRLQSPQYVAWMLASSDDITRTLEPGSIVAGGNRKGPKSLSMLIIVSGLV